MYFRCFLVQEGVIASGYDTRAEYGQYARVLQFTKLFLFGPGSAIVTCPLAMTDGAARLIEQLRVVAHAENEHLHPKLEAIHKQFVSRDPATFATCGQWMTETTGGSHACPLHKHTHTHTHTHTIIIRTPDYCTLIAA